MARKPLRPLIRSGGFYPSRKWTPLVYAGGYTTANGGEEPAPPPIEKTVTGNPIHITDALAKPVQALSVALEPIQDLHGYDNPWPAGGGKQIYNSATFSTVTSGTITCTNNGDGSFTFNAEEADTVNRFFDIFNNQFSESVGGNPLPSAEYRLTGTPSGGSSSNYTMYTRPSYGNDTGNGVTFTNSVIGGSILIKAGYRPQNLVFRPMIRLASVGDDTWQPYSNICPISGHTDADVVRTGKNLVNGTDFTTFASWKDDLVSYGDYPTSSSNRAFKLPIAAGQTYTLFFGMTSGSFGKYVYLCSADGTNSYRNFAFSTGTLSNNTYTFTAESGKFYYIRSGSMTNETSFNTQIALIGHCQLELGSPATDYEPYVGTTYPIPLGTTVYGGTLDVVNGTLTIEWAIEDMGTLSWTYVTNDGTPFYYRASVADRAIGSFNMQSSVFQVSTASGTRNLPDCGIVGSSSSVNVFVRWDAYTDATDFTNAVTGQTLCYELATPQTIQLTPQQVELLQGENNIWSDGTMTLVYLADGNASDIEALNILLGNRYVNNHGEDEPTDREALDILLGR